MFAVFLLLAAIARAASVSSSFSTSTACYTLSGPARVLFTPTVTVELPGSISRTSVTSTGTLTVVATSTPAPVTTTITSTTTTDLSPMTVTATVTDTDTITATTSLPPVTVTSTSTVDGGATTTYTSAPSPTSKKRDLLSRFEAKAQRQRAQEKDLVPRLGPSRATLFKIGVLCYVRRIEDLTTTVPKTVTTTTTTTLPPVTSSSTTTSTLYATPPSVTISATVSATVTTTDTITPVPITTATTTTTYTSTRTLAAACMPTNLLTMSPANPGEYISNAGLSYAGTTTFVPGGDAAGCCDTCYNTPDCGVSLFDINGGGGYMQETGCYMDFDNPDYPVHYVDCATLQEPVFVIADLVRANPTLVYDGSQCYCPAC